jgi:hypothetical protein
MSVSRPSLALTLMAALALFVMGCAATAASSAVPGILLLVAALSLGVQGCFLMGDAQQDMALEQDGVWERCCTDFAVDGMCFCSAGTACNYIWTCGIDHGYAPTPDMEPDAASDMDGAWEPCCEDGEISMCFCAGNVECNYGWFTSCDPATSIGGVECVFGGPDACIGDVQDMAPDMVESDMSPDLGD